MKGFNVIVQERDGRRYRVAVLARSSTEACITMLDNLARPVSLTASPTGRRKAA